MVTESVIVSSRCVSRIVAGPLAVSAGENSIVSCAAWELANSIASRSEKSPAE